FLAAAPARAGVQVTVDADPAADFAKLKTYAWADAPAEASVPAATHERIHAAVDRELRAKGLVPAAQDPDLLITYDASATQEFHPAEKVRGYGQGNAAFGGIGWYDKPAKTYRKGTLVLRMADARAGKLAWQGTATGAVHEQPEKNAKKIDETVKKLLA